MKRVTKESVEYKSPQVTEIQLSTEQVCIAASGSSDSGIGFDDMFENEGEWAVLN